MNSYMNCAAHLGLQSLLDKADEIRSPWYDRLLFIIVRSNGPSQGTLSTVLAEQWCKVSYTITSEVVVQL